MALKELKTKVNEDDYQAFMNAVESSGDGSVYAVLKNLIDGYLKSSNKKNENYKKSKKVEFQKRTKTVSTRLNEKEYESMIEILDAEKKDKAEFLLCLVRARINKEAHFSEEEINVLRDANRQIKAVGRNLNQLIKLINYGEHESTGFTVDDLQELNVKIEQQGSALMSLIKKNNARDVNDG